MYNEISEKSKDPAVLSTLKKEYLNYAVTIVLYAELADSSGQLNESEPVAKIKISVDNVSDSDLVGRAGYTANEGTSFQKAVGDPSETEVWGIKEGYSFLMRLKIKAEGNMRPGLESCYVLREKL